ncbi:MAG: Crp/Fnr family transcriptional regulator [Bacteroidota bacterium]
MVAIDVLLDYGAEIVLFDKHSTIFDEGDTPRYFYSIVSGSVKMFNLTEDGKEFIQGLFEKGQSFGEPPIFGDFKYPASAACIQKSELIRLQKGRFFDLLDERKDIHLAFTRHLSNRLHYKSMIMKEVSVHSASHRILTLLNYLKKEKGRDQPYAIKLSRQQLAELTGLRVETVVRTIKKLERNNELSIIKRQIVI